MSEIDCLCFYGLSAGTFTVEVLASGAVVIRGDGGEMSLPPPTDETVSGTVRGAPFAFIARGAARVEPPAIVAAPAKVTVADAPARPQAPPPPPAPPKRSPAEACPKCGHGPPHQPNPGTGDRYCINCTAEWRL